VSRATTTGLVGGQPISPQIGGEIAVPEDPWIRSRWGSVRALFHAGLLVVSVLITLVMVEVGHVHTDGRIVVWLMPGLVLIMLAVRGIYRPCIQLDMVGDVLRILAATSLAAIVILAGTDLFDPSGEPAQLIVRAWILATLLLTASVPVLTAVERRSRRLGGACMPTLVVGSGQVGAEVERRLSEKPELGRRVVGYIDTDSGLPQQDGADRAPVLGTPEELMRVVDETGAGHVIFTFTTSPDQALVPLIRACEERGLQVSLVPRMFECVNHRASFDSIGPLPVFHLDHVDPKGWQFTVKHVFDRIASAVLLVCVAPVMAAVAVAVRASSPGPIMFRQHRVGRDGHHFEMLKFRSMRPQEEGPADTGEWVKPGMAPGGVEGDDRRTAVGAFIRRYSLDELPQLINVLKGDMSLIGPRPERPEFVQIFGEKVHGYADRHRVKSGITGLAQTNGFRGQTSLTERIELDNYYIHHWSMVLDLKILLGTFAAVIRSAE
jgi:exopolysaccharide biosynthesis polyprenyl glycosylphosphotransferase